MKKLILMRHSNAENDSPTIPDIERNITEKGIQLIKTQALKLQKKSLFPDRIITSPAKRAFNTAALLAKQLNIHSNITIESFLYDDYTTQEFLNYLRKMPDSLDTVLIVGHNPTISRIASLLTNTHSFSFSPASIAVISISVEQWQFIEVELFKAKLFMAP
ncbi:MAG: histidine phosphatase family protein [Salinivirgaceae bacterium]|jgi:phosphohistidine phosphatase